VRLQKKNLYVFEFPVGYRPTGNKQLINTCGEVLSNLKLPVWRDTSRTPRMTPGLYFLAMGGFFLDNLIGVIVKGIRRENRATTAENWPIVDAKITNPGCAEGARRPGVTYSYAVNGETWYGSSIGYPFRDAEIEKARSALSAVSVLRIRYDPADPAESRVLNRDNPWLPFEIDHDPY